MMFLCRLYLVCSLCDFCIFFFKQKTAYEMRISDWSSDVCSSDLLPTHFVTGSAAGAQGFGLSGFATGVAAGLFAYGGWHMVTYKIGRASCRERVCQYV